MMDQIILDFETAIKEALRRLMEMALIAVPGSAAETYGSYERPMTNLYWRFTPNTQQPPRRMAVNRFRMNVPLTASLIVGQVQQGVGDGDLERTLYFTHIPRVMAYFTNHRRLIYEHTVPAQQPPRFFVAGIGLGISFVGGVPAGSDGTKLLGARFVMTLPFQIELDGTL